MYQKGLKDVVAVHTKIASVEGDIGELRYRGILVGELITKHSFEEIAHFLWNGNFPKDESIYSSRRKRITRSCKTDHRRPPARNASNGRDANRNIRIRA